MAKIQTDSFRKDIFTSLWAKIVSDFRNHISHEKCDIYDACQETLRWLHILSQKEGEEWRNYNETDISENIKKEIPGDMLLLCQLFHATCDSERGDKVTTFPLRVVLNIVVTQLFKKFGPRRKRVGSKRKGRGASREIDERSDLYDYKNHSFSKMALKAIHKTRIEDHVGPEFEGFLTLVVKKFTCQYKGESGTNNIERYLKLYLESLFEDDAETSEMIDEEVHMISTYRKQSYDDTELKVYASYVDRYRKERQLLSQTNESANVFHEETGLLEENQQGSEKLDDFGLGDDPKALALLCRTFDMTCFGALDNNGGSDDDTTVDIFAQQNISASAESNLVLPTVNFGSSTITNFWNKSS